jgi:antitoxin ParD1/3/4
MKRPTGWRPDQLAKICHRRITAIMSTMNISLPETLKSFVDERVSNGGYGTSSEYVRELIRDDQDRQSLRALLLEGAASAPSAPADGAYFDALRRRARRPKAG